MSIQRSFGLHHIDTVHFCIFDSWLNRYNYLDWYFAVDYLWLWREHAIAFVRSGNKGVLVVSQKILSAIMGIALLSVASPASAAVLLDTITGGGSYQSGDFWYVYNTDGSGQSVALTFSSATDTTITGVEAYIGPNVGPNLGPVTLGIMADVAGLPSGTFLNSQSVGLSVSSPIILSSLNWSIAAGTTYWLAAIAANGSSAQWDRNSSFATTVAFDFPGPGLNKGGDFTESTNPVEALITSGVATTPLPSTWLMLLSGFVGLGFFAYRGTKKRTVLAAA
jgi:spore maturation protein SpmB